MVVEYHGDFVRFKPGLFAGQIKKRIPGCDSEYASSVMAPHVASGDLCDSGLQKCNMISM